MSDPWGTTSAGNLPALRRKPAEPVKDAWDDDDDDGDAPEDNRKAWEDANSAAPMPQIIAAPQPASASAPIPASATAMLNQPAMRILKRPSGPPSPASSGSSSSKPIADTLADRQARYDAARQRIFAHERKGLSTEGLESVPSASPKPLSPPPGQAAVRVSRNPRGPDATPPASPVAKGFGSRRRSGVPKPQA